MRFVAFLFVLIILLLGGGTAFLMTWDIPPPTAPVQKVIPNDRLPK